MSDAIVPKAIVRLRHDHTVIGIVHEVDGGRAGVVFGLPQEAIGRWIPLYDLEVVAWEDLAEVPMVLIA